MNSGENAWKKRDFLKLAGITGLSALTGNISGRATSPSSQAPPYENGFENVLESGVLRCGYVVYAPNFIKDPVTGKFSGIFYDLMEQVGKNLGLKLEWAEEAGLSELTASLENRRLDVVGSGLWSNAARARVVDYSKPVFFNSLGVYTRKNENRFTSLEDLNKPGVRIAVIDGGMADQLANTDFPNAQRVSLPPLSDYPFLLKMVAARKADFTISATHEYAGYAKNNADELKRLDADLPIRILPNVLFVRKGNQKLQTMLDAALDELYYAGVTNRLVDQYEEFTGSFLRLQTPYLPAAT